MKHHFLPIRKKFHPFYSISRSEASSKQVCQIFLDTIYQTGEIYTKQHIKYYKCPFRMQSCPKNPIGHYIHQPLPYQGPPKFTQIGFFGLKIYHLATLVPNRSRVQNLQNV
jgi:hypothetical protein